MTSAENFDVVLVGAGISGLGFAYHLTDQAPSKSYVILEQLDTFGGTWATHKYPGVRSDSDLYTFGYRFKPWTGAPIATGEKILNYLEQVIDENQLAGHIRYKNRIETANWCSEAGLWTIGVRDLHNDALSYITCQHFVWTGGYFEQRKGYTPDWPGLEEFEGEIIHPQTWPDDVDLNDKQVVVIGSGATAATLIPNIANHCAHVTMLQRSPTYFWTGENRNLLAEHLRSLEVPEQWVHEIVRRDLLKTQKEIQELAAQYPEQAREEVLSVVREYLGGEITRKHFTPDYRPWQQRLAYVPDGDLFEAIKSGNASVVTDEIEKFVSNGIVLKSGETLEADVIITATGFNMLDSGGIAVSVDGRALKFGETYTYRGIMLSGVPNFMMMFGYFRTSWTMRVDLLADYLIRLFKYMDEIGAQSVTPMLRPKDEGMNAGPWVSEEEFNPGYMKRSLSFLPKSGDKEPWQFNPNYYLEKDLIPKYNLDDDALVYAKRVRGASNQVR